MIVQFCKPVPQPQSSGQSPKEITRALGRTPARAPDQARELGGTRGVLRTIIVRNIVILKLKKLCIIMIAA